MLIGWIDFSKSERNKVLSILDLLSESGTLDELGIAPVRDGFSNLFFPGTSTIQTRAKYFFAVPYALKDLERSNETSPSKILKSLDTIEKRCGEILLMQNQDENGVIGKRALTSGSWVKRTPTNIYWAGLRKYGILLNKNLSLAEYVKAVCTLKVQKSMFKKLGNNSLNEEENKNDDKNAGDLTSLQFWNMPLYSEKWIDNFSINLSKEEAEFLREQIVMNCKGTMLSYILEYNIIDFLECESFQDLALIIDRFPKEIQADYFLALSFSRFIYSIRTVYNIIVSDGENKEAKIELEKMLPLFKEIADIDIDFILLRLRVSNISLKKFLYQTKNFMINGDYEMLKKCIISREIQLKGSNRAKTVHAGEFDSNNWIGGKEIDYRFHNAKTIVRDILESDGVNNASS